MHLCFVMWIYRSLFKAALRALWPTFFELLRYGLWEDSCHPWFLAEASLPLLSKPLRMKTAMHIGWNHTHFPVFSPRPSLGFTNRPSLVSWGFFWEVGLTSRSCTPGCWQHVSHAGLLCHWKGRFLSSVHRKLTYCSPYGLLRSIDLGNTPWNVSALIRFT